MYVTPSKILFVMKSIHSDVGKPYYLLDVYGNLVSLGEGSSRYEMLVPVHGHPWSFIFQDGARQYLIQDQQTTLLQVELGINGDVFAAYRNGASTMVFSDEKIETFDYYDDVDTFDALDGEPLEMYSMLKLADGNFVVCARDGLYRYSTDSVYRISDIDGVRALNFYDFDEGRLFVAGSGNMIKKSKNCKKWDDFFKVSSGGIVVNDIFIRNRSDFYMSTTDGLYKTMYSYRLVNDFDSRNEFEMRQFVQQLSGELEDTYELDLARHIQKYHQPDDVMTRIDDRSLSVNFEAPAASWCQTASNEQNEYIVVNDMVYSMDFGDSYSGAIRVDVENYLGKTGNIPSEYISRDYCGGVVELFVHIPTTKNYYLNYAYGSPNCSKEQSTVSRTRRNLEATSEVPAESRSQTSEADKHYSTVTLVLNKQLFGIQQVMGVEINGCSLPLKIYKDEISQTNPDANNLFGGVMLPSLVGGYELSAAEGHKFTFYCFGTDEQSIKISYLGDKTAE